MLGKSTNLIQTLWRSTGYVLKSVLIRRPLDHFFSYSLDLLTCSLNDIFLKDHCPLAQQVSAETEKCGLVAIISMGGHNEWQVSINQISPISFYSHTRQTVGIVRFQSGAMVKMVWFGLKTFFAATLLNQLKMNWPWRTIFQEVLWTIFLGCGSTFHRWLWSKNTSSTLSIFPPDH